MPHAVIGSARTPVRKKRTRIRGKNPRISIGRIVEKPDKRHGVIHRVYHRMRLVIRVIQHRHERGNKHDANIRSMRTQSTRSI